ncbi:MAG: TauD/TfdA family dioxygenase [Isosphaeraceae bacterium]
MAKDHAEFPQANASAWRAGNVGPESSWRLPLPAHCAEALIALAHDLSRSATPLVATRISDESRRVWSEEFAAVREALEHGRGFAIVEGPANPELRPEAKLALYWIVGQVLGEPVAQNVQGITLYDVRDTGQSVSQGARFSVTNAESTFHTDASFEDGVVDYVGLLCLNAAKSGGLSQLVSGYTVAAELARTDPDAFEILTQPFHVDRRGGVRPGESPTARRPVLARKPDDLLYRYLRTWIEVGHEKAGEPLTTDQIAALDALDRTMNRADLRAEFMLRPGDMFFSNNRWTLHNRTAFEDHPELERRRHYVRLWLEARRESPAESLLKDFLSNGIV